MQTVRVRVMDSRDKDEYDLSADERALSVPQEFPDHIRALRIRDPNLIEYEDRYGWHSARTRETRLGETHPGERVLVEFEGPYEDPPGWHLCEVEDLDGDDFGSS
jgi:hypothetical protein